MPLKIRRCRPLLPALAACWLAAAPVAAIAQDGAPPPLPAAGVPAPERMAWFARYQDARGGPEVTERVTRTFKVGPNGSLEIFNLAGPIVVTGGAGEAIVVEAIKRARGHGEDAREQLAAVGIDAVENGGRVEVRTVVRSRIKQLRTWVDYTVTVPYGTAVTARALAGDVKVANVQGDVQVESTSGSVEATGTPRLVRVKTMSGDVLITNAAAVNALLASTVSGRLVARGVKAQSLELATISGDLLLVNTTSDRAQVRTVSGTLEFAGALSKNGRYEFNSHAGDIRLRLAKQSGFELAAKTFSGDLRSELKLTLDADREGPHAPGSPRRRDIRGTFGDGSALVLVKTFSGSVVVGAENAPHPAPPPPKAPRPPKPPKG